MLEIGYKLSSEEFGPTELVDQAVQAERAGFSFALISDHFHPWSDRQGQSPFVWGVLGAIARATTRLRVGTAVTCPTIRTHPAIIAQAAATAAALMPGRFFLGVGTGENLNEHVVGRGWPPAAIRLEMLEEAIAVIRLLWKGGMRSHRGRYFVVQEARLYTLPEKSPPIMVAASRPGAAELAARAGDAMINTEVEPPLLQRFRGAGGAGSAGKPCFVEHTVCWGTSERRARKTAHEIWPLAGLGGRLFTELALPSDFEAAYESITEAKVAEAILCGPDPRRHVEALRKAERAGYTHVCVHQVGPEQAGFLDFYAREVLPKFTPRRERAGEGARAAGTGRSAAATRAPQRRGDLEQSASTRRKAGRRARGSR